MSGIKISKPGHPVESAAPRNLVFSSEFNSMKVAFEKSGDIDTKTVTIPHGQASVRVHLVYIKGPYGFLGEQAWILLPMNTPDTTIFYSVDIDINNVYIRRSATPSAPYDIYRVFVFADQVK